MPGCVKLSFDGGVLCASIVGELDHHVAKGVREEIDGELIEKRPRRLHLDFSHLTFMDSSGIGLILGRRELCERLGVELWLVGLSKTTRKLVRLSGIERLSGVVIK